MALIGKTTLEGEYTDGDVIEFGFQAHTIDSEFRSTPCVVVFAHYNENPSKPKYKVVYVGHTDDLSGFIDDHESLDEWDCIVDQKVNAILIHFEDYETQRRNIADLVKRRQKPTCTSD